MSLISITRGEESYGVPDRLPVLPLREVVVFPYMVVPLLVGRPGSLGAIEAALADDRWIFLVAQRDGDVQEPAAADLYRVGVVGRVQQISRMANGTTKVLLEGTARARVTRYSPNEMFLRATVTPLPFAAKSSAATASVATVSASIEVISATNGDATGEAGEDALDLIDLPEAQGEMQVERALGKLAALNTVLILGENDVDADGNIKMTLWEWK